MRDRAKRKNKADTRKPSAHMGGSRERRQNCCKACNYFYENEVSDGAPVCNVSSDGKTFKDCKILKENGVEDEE